VITLKVALNKAFGGYISPVFPSHLI